MEKWLEKFIYDPDWERLEDWIADFFSHETDISTINIDRSSEAVHAEIIARQKIAEDIKNFKASCESLRALKDKKTTTFR